MHNWDLKTSDAALASIHLPYFSCKQFYLEGFDYILVHIYGILINLI